MRGEREREKRIRPAQCPYDLFFYIQTFACLNSNLSEIGHYFFLLTESFV